MFKLSVSNLRSVQAECAVCRNVIRVYDLALYPAASKPLGSEQYQPMDVPKSPSLVFVAFEYGELDEDQEFDTNDITWCQIFIEDDAGELLKVFDDETA
jgi:hypothetical protein